MLPVPINPRVLFVCHFLDTIAVIAISGRIT